jgi:hypothetical protein
MKILVSSKGLAFALKQVQFKNGEYIKSAALKGTDLILSTENKDISIMVEPLIYSNFCPQLERRWDWVKDLVSKVDEQPIVLNITEGGVEVIFQY